MDIFDEAVDKKRYNLKNRNCLVVDYGYFLAQAIRLSKDFNKTFYVPFGWKGSFTKPEKALIGSGIKGLIHDIDFYEALKEIDKERDLIAMFEIGNGAMMENLREQGYKHIFSMGNSEILEQNRYKFKEFLENLKLPTIPYNGGNWRRGYVIGLNALEKRLKEIDGNKWIKISTHRALSETFKFVSYPQVKPILDMMRHKTGTFAEKVEFIIEDDVEGIEGGCDMFFANGYYFNKCLYGFEDKGDAYFAKVIDTGDLPSEFKIILGRIAPFLKKNGANGMFSTEIRIAKDGTYYFIDPTQRLGNPPGDLQSYMFINFSELVFAAASGELCMPIAKNEYGVQLNLHDIWAEKETMIIEYPKEIEDNVKLRNIAKIDGYLQYIPQSDSGDIGSVVSTANSIDKALDNCFELAEQIKCVNLKYKKDFNSFIKSIKENKKYGLKEF
jgi:hypothetical protein